MRRTASCTRTRQRRAEAIALLAALGCAGTLTPAAAEGQTPDAPEQAASLEIGDQPAHTTLVYPPFAHTLGIHRARPAHLQLFLGDRTRFADPQGLAAVKFASDDDPEARGDDFQLTLFGVNSERGEIIYNSSMKTLAVYGRRGGADGEFAEPHGIAAAVDGRVYVADTGNRRIVRLRWDPVARALSWGGSWPAGAPFDVDADERGDVWATDREQNAVLRFSDREASEAVESRAAAAVSGDRWPLPDDVDAPLGLAIMDSLDPWLQPNATRLYLVDHDGRRLRAYDVEGRVVASIAAADVAEGEETARFFYVAIDYFGNIYATDPGNGRIYKLDAELRPLASFAGPGPAESALEEPRGIAIWKRFGQVFVAEREGAQYFFVGADFRPLSDPLRVRRAEVPAAWTLEGFLTEAATVRVAFLDGAGDTLAIADAGTVGTGRQVVAWDGEDWESAPAEGWEERAQQVVVEARPTYSSRRRFARVRAFPLTWEGP